MRVVRVVGNAERMSARSWRDISRRPKGWLPGGGHGRYSEVPSVPHGEAGVGERRIHRRDSSWTTGRDPGATYWSRLMRTSPVWDLGEPAGVSCGRSRIRPGGAAPLGSA